MAVYDAFLGDLGESYDAYDELLVGGVTYSIAVFGASSSRTLPEPAVAVYDTQGNLNLRTDELNTNSWLLGEDVFITWTAPSTGIYQFDVFDEIGGTGSYTFAVTPAGPPVFLDSIGGLA